MNRRLFLSAVAALPFAWFLPQFTPPPPSPRFANGGIIKHPGLYLVGEHGPEMILPR